MALRSHEKEKTIKEKLYRQEDQKENTSYIFMIAFHISQDVLFLPIDQQEKVQISRPF